MAAYAYDPQRAQRRTMVLIGAIVLHIILIWGFASGLAHDLVKFVAPPLDTSIIEEAKVDDKPPPPPPPELERPPVQVVAPEITINLTPDAPPPPITQVTTQPVITTPRPPAPPAPVVPDTPLKALSIANPEDMYPSAAKQAGQEGVVRVKVCIAESSKIDSIEIGETSGFPLLDDAGVRVAKTGRYQAAKKAGKAMASCANLPIRFSLKK
jgi:protein TonB